MDFVGLRLRSLGKNQQRHKSEGTKFKGVKGSGYPQAVRGQEDL